MSEAKCNSVPWPFYPRVGGWVVETWVFAQILGSDIQGSPNISELKSSVDAHSFQVCIAK